MQKLTILFEGFIDKDGEIEQVVEQVKVTTENCKNIGEALKAYVSYAGINTVKHPNVLNAEYRRDL